MMAREHYLQQVAGRPPSMAHEKQLFKQLIGHDAQGKRGKLCFA